MNPAQLNALLDRLIAEHEELLPRVKRLVALAEARDPALGPGLDDLAETLGAPLEGHIAAEDDDLFPVYTELTGERGLVAVFVAEHREILELRDELLSLRRRAVDEVDLARAFLDWADLLTRHMEREELMLFPSLREIAGVGSRG